MAVTDWQQLQNPVFECVTDLNVARLFDDPELRVTAGVVDVHGQAGFRAADGAPAAAHVSSLRRALPGRAQGQELLVPRSVPVHGLRVADLSREPARHRSLPASAGQQALSSGDSQPGRVQHARRRPRAPRLAAVRRLRTAAHCHGASVVCQRCFCRGARQNGLRARCHNHRPVPVGVSLGAFSLVFEQTPLDLLLSRVAADPDPTEPHNQMNFFE